jgi:hypothetical protein
VGTAVITSVVYLVCAKYLALAIWPASLVAFAAGFFFRLAALWRAWEEPMPRVPPEVLGEVKERQTLAEKMQPGWKPEE